MNDRDYVSEAAQYAEQIVSRKIPACQWVQFACQRQLNDLRRKDFPYRFNPELTDYEGKQYRPAERICRFIELLPHVEGRWPTKTIRLEPWQCFFLTTIFGWIDERGFRRFRKALIVIPRKNTKTTIAAAVALFLFAADGEPGARVYSAATTRDQAKLSWLTARTMVQRTPALRECYGIEALAHSIAIEHEAAFFQPLSRDVDTLEGLNVHGAIIDELHAHKTRDVFDVLDEGTGARSQPLMFIISTEGDNPAGVFAEQVNYLQAILGGQHEDETYFGIFYGIDKEDEWTHPDSWRKANPHIGVIDARGRAVLFEDIRTRFRQAQKNAQSQSSFLTKRLNVRVGAGQAYFNMLAWNLKCKIPELKIEDFYGRPCFMHMDLASKRDIAAKVMLFEELDGTYAVFGKYYLPENAIEQGNPNYDIYRGWANQGWLTLTPGEVTDYEFIEQDVLEDLRNFQVRGLLYDPYQATYLVTRLQAAGVKAIEYQMTVAKFSDPMKQVDADIISGKLKHGGDPVLGWMLGNVVARRDAKDNVFPRKAREENKIDGAVSLIAARGWMLAQPVEIRPQIAVF